MISCCFHKEGYLSQKLSETNERRDHMQFVSVAEAAVEMRIPVSMLRGMCESGLIEGAVRFGRIWALPENFCEEGYNLPVGCEFPAC